MDSDTKADLQERVRETDIRFNQRTRQDEGWFGTYVECPDCEVPFVRVTTESESMALDEETSISESKHVGICPDCHDRQVVLKVEKLVGPFQ